MMLYDLCDVIIKVAGTVGCAGHEEDDSGAAGVGAGTEDAVCAARRGTHQAVRGDGDPDRTRETARQAPRTGARTKGQVTSGHVTSGQVRSRKHVNSH